MVVNKNGEPSKPPQSMTTDDFLHDFSSWSLDSRDHLQWSLVSSAVTMESRIPYQRDFLNQHFFFFFFFCVRRKFFSKLTQKQWLRKNIGKVHSSFAMSRNLLVVVLALLLCAAVQV